MRRDKTRDEFWMVDENRSNAEQQPRPEANGKQQRLENDDRNHPPVRSPVFGLLHVPELIVGRTARHPLTAINEQRQFELPWEVSPDVIGFVMPAAIPRRESIGREQYYPGLRLNLHGLKGSRPRRRFP